jgi:hypothetical protein
MCPSLLKVVIAADLARNQTGHGPFNALFKTGPAGIRTIVIDVVAEVPASPEYLLAPFHTRLKVLPGIVDTLGVRCPGQDRGGHQHPSKQNNSAKPKPIVSHNAPPLSFFPVKTSKDQMYPWTIKMILNWQSIIFLCSCQHESLHTWVLAPLTAPFPQILFEVAPGYGAFLSRCL